MLKYNRFVGEIWMWINFLEWAYDCFTFYALPFESNYLQ